MPAKKIVHTYEECRRRASMYSSRWDYGQNDGASYQTIRSNKWWDILDDLFPKDIRFVPVVVFGVEYKTTNEALAANGFDRTAGVKKHAENKGLGIGEYIEWRVNRRNKLAAKKQKAKERKILREKNKVFVGEYTRIAFCKGCGKPFSREGTFYKIFCNDDCEINHKKILQIKSNKKSKARLRAAGKDNRGKPRKRHAKHGGVYDRSITAKSVALRDGMICQICFGKVEPHKGKGYQPNGWSVGHIVAVADGGNTVWENVQCEHSHCNSIKGKKPMGQIQLFSRLAA